MPDPKEVFPFRDLANVPLPALPKDGASPSETPLLLPELDRADTQPTHTPMPADWPSHTPRPEVPDYGNVESERRAVLFLSDMHFSDGSVGDDAFHEHLIESGGEYVGRAGPRTSTSHLVSRLMRWAVEEAKAADIDSIDIVLNGDVFDLLAMLARGTRWSSSHDPILSACERAIQEGHDVHYLAGNHDFLIPKGPWKPGWTYANPVLKTFAEHGHRYDANNWPHGPESVTAQMVIGSRNTGFLSLARLETISTLDSGCVEYPLAGLDNVFPVEPKSYVRFLRSRFMENLYGQTSPEAFVGYVLRNLATLEFHGHPDDSMGLRGAAWMRGPGPFHEWLMVQGHTHVPVAIPGVYYNTGSFTPVLRQTEVGAETLARIHPCLFVFLDSNSVRQEVFVAAHVSEAGVAVARHNRASINRLRVESYGYPPY